MHERVNSKITIKRLRASFICSRCTTGILYLLPNLSESFSRHALYNLYRYTAKNNVDSNGNEQKNIEKETTKTLCLSPSKRFSTPMLSAQFCACSNPAQFLIEAPTSPFSSFVAFHVLHSFQKKKKKETKKARGHNISPARSL